MPTYHTQPSPTWRDRFTQRELALIKNCRTYAENDPAGLPNHDLLMLVARLSEALDTLPLHEVSPKLFELMQDFFEQKWLEGKLSELFSDEDIHDLLAVLAPYVGGGESR